MELALDVRVLGTLQVRVGEQPADLGGPRAREVLALLLVHLGEVVTLDRAVDQVWGEHPPPTARTTLQAYVSRLRRVLGSRLRHEAAGYVLRLGPGELDAARFAEHLAAVGSEESARARPDTAFDRLHAGLLLWRGSPYADLDHLSFVRVEAERLTELRLLALRWAALAAVPLGRGQATVPLLAQAVREHPLREELVEQYVRALYAGGRQADALAALEECRRALADQLGVDLSPALRRLQAAVLEQRAELAAPDRPDGPARQPVRSLPARTAAFTGRDRLLEEVDGLLTLGRAGRGPATVVLHGLGGIGKTQLAVEHLYRCSGRYAITWWVPAADRVSAATALVELAGRLGLPARRTQADTIAGLWDELGARDDWLLVYDGPADPTEVADVLPPAGDGHVLVTSRNPAWRQVGATLAVPVLSRAESLALLRRRSGRAETAGDDESDTLAALLGDLPLALEQASAYLEQTGMDVASYLRLYEDRAEALLARGTTPGGSEGVATTWQLAFEEVARDEPVAARLLGVMSLVAPEPVPLSVLAVLAPDPVELQDALAALLRFSLLWREAGQVRVHRLVAAVLRSRLDRADRQGLLGLGAEALLAHTSRHGADRLVPHVRALAAAGLREHTCPEPLPALVRAAAGVLLRHAAHADAAHTLEAGLALARGVSAPPEVVAGLLSDLGQVRDAAGDVRGARDVLEQAVRLLQDAQGPESLAAGLALNRLGHALTCSGEIMASVRVHERALGVLRRHGDIDGDTARVLTDLGSAHWAAGDLRLAGQRFEEALELLNPSGDDRARADALGGLGQVLQDEGHLEAARRCQEQAVEAVERACGHEHPATAEAYDKLGFVARLLGDLEYSVRLHGRAVVLLGAALGPHDPRTAMARTNLGLALAESGDLSGAAAAQGRAAEDFVAAYGPGHPHVAMAVRRQAALLSGGSSGPRAVELLESALRTSVRRLGRGHPDVGRTLLELARARAAAGDGPGAARASARAVQVLGGAYHPEAADVVLASELPPAGD